MTKYREILRLNSLGLSQSKIAYSCNVSKSTVNRVIKKSKELKLSWPLNESQTDVALAKLFFPSTVNNKMRLQKRLPDFAYIRKELLKNGVSKKLLWTEYMEECRMSGDIPLMYSQFCYHIQQEEQKRRATMHINRKPGEQVEVDWAGDPAKITDPDTGENIDAHIFVGVLSYSQYAYVEAFVNEKQLAWITAHVHMYEYFSGVTRILVPDNCKTAVVHNKGWYNQKLNTTYHEMAEHYGTAIIPARVRKPKDKPNAEGVVGNISTWITAALRNEQFFSLAELNIAIREKLKAFNSKKFQKKEGSRKGLYQNEELPYLLQLPSAPYEIAEWKKATVQFNYHISVDGMYYSIPHEFIKHKVDVRMTDKIIEVFYNHNRIASHKRLKGRKGQYNTIIEHMPHDHQVYLKWNAAHFRNWAKKIGHNTYLVIDTILLSRRVEQQAYKSCIGLLKLADKYSDIRLEAACKKALSFTSNPSYKIIKNILVIKKKVNSDKQDKKTRHNKHGITRGANYYGGNKNDK